MNGSSWLWAALAAGVLSSLIASASRAGEQPGAAAADEKFPHLWLTNGSVRMMLYLPAGQKGYYVGSRFERSGVVARAEVAGHVFFGPWQPRNPKTHDHIMGTAEEFSMDDPPGFDEVRAGGVFYKIGVGALEKVETRRKNKQTGQMEPEPYGFHRGHKIVKLGRWKVTHGRGWVQFVQGFRGERGWAWHYTKRVELAKDAPKFTISRALRNTGTKTLDTTHYCHNFTIIDGQPIGTSYRVRLGFAAKAEELKGTAAAVRNREIVFVKDLAQRETVWMQLAGLTGSPEDQHLTIENTKAKASLEITGDRAPVIVRFWSAHRAACPEPFVAVKVAAGKTMNWKNTYTFHVTK
jgi:hypothetical protein